VSLGDRELAQQLETGLLRFSRTTRQLPGIQNFARRRAFVRQLLESIHRVKFVTVVRTRPLSDLRSDPDSELFDPLKAAILNFRQGNVEESFWLVFLFVHFGKNVRGGWRYAREIYGKLGAPGRWDWATTSEDPGAFRNWLEAHQHDLKRDGVPGGFGNHRKYESLDARSPAGTGAVVEGYVQWVNPPRTHQLLFEKASHDVAGDPGRAFDVLYHSMKNVPRFGRTARFDYLTMVGKIGLVPIEPGSAYMGGSTGPVKGARLLFGASNSTTAAALDLWLIELGVHLQVGMQVLEDALCNWQKSPARFKPFRG
jgi:Alpha-glutamyl/putrescinyl thymine pyrophosphorylase clade 3